MNAGTDYIMDLMNALSASSTHMLPVTLYVLFITRQENAEGDAVPGAAVRSSVPSDGSSATGSHMRHHEGTSHAPQSRYVTCDARQGRHMRHHAETSYLTPGRDVTCDTMQGRHMRHHAGTSHATPCRNVTCATNEATLHCWISYHW